MDHVEYAITLPGGATLPGSEPVVVIGPNGSGKTRKSREISTTSGTPDFINALRNTRVAPELQASNLQSARNNLASQKANARNNYWEMSAEFDWMLSQLLAQHAGATMKFHRQLTKDPNSFTETPTTPLSKVEQIWSKVFEGREISFDEWTPMIKNVTTGNEYSYNGTYMSDGEKSALYLIGRILLADSGVVVVDEPETHFHSLLAVRLWDVLEEARPDLRFVYVTHDLTFALSRRKARFVLATPIGEPGLRPLDLDASSMPGDVAQALLGSASLSFYASRAVFCEGEETSYDARLYGAWFNGQDTVVRSVTNSDTVIRCVQAINMGGIVTSLSPIGIVDSDYHPERWKQALTAGVTVLGVHEVESLFALPGVVEAVCTHNQRSFDADAYRTAVRGSVTAAQAQKIIVDRWKASLEPFLEGLMSAGVSRGDSVANLVKQLPDLFDHTKWNFSPQGLLETEQDHVESILETGNLESLLLLVPGKQMLPIAARTAGLDPEAYVNVILKTLDAPANPENKLATALGVTFKPYLPDRYGPTRGLPNTL